MMNTYTLAEIDAIAAAVSVRLNNHPRVGIILGSGLGALAEARRVSDAPLLIGGPHATLWPEQMAATGADYIVSGEAEAEIVALVEGATRQTEPLVVECSAPDVTRLPWAGLAFVASPMTPPGK